ncbi:MAG: hypothetical protein NC412_05385 [Roseburia sp.]|nr:hypothetical protein [Roseburia sp.]MCM1278488.1 hypothetical protein [Robinsoniella sp.]
MGDIKCVECGSSYDKMFLLGKQGNANICPMCGADMVASEEHPDWITWYYYKDILYGDCCLFDKQPLKPDKLELVKEFKAPPRDANGNSDAAKQELRKYVPDAFTESKTVPKVQCPYCFSKEVQLVPKKFSLLTGFATNSYNRVCVRCQRKF